MSEPVITPVQSRSAENKAAESHSRSNGGDAAPQWSAPAAAPAPSGWPPNVVASQPQDAAPTMRQEHPVDNFQSTFAAPPVVPNSASTAVPPQSTGGWPSQSGGAPQRLAPAAVPPAQDAQMPAAGQSSSPFASMPQAVAHQQQALAPAQDAPPPAPAPVNLGPKPALSRRGFRLPGGPFNPQQAKAEPPPESLSTVPATPVPASLPAAPGWVAHPESSPQPAWAVPPSPSPEPAWGSTPVASAWSPPPQPSGWSPPPVLPPAQPQMPPAALAPGAEAAQPAGWSQPAKPPSVAAPVPGADVFMRVTADQSGAPRLSEPVPQQAAPVAPLAPATMQPSESASAALTASQSNRPLPPPVDLDRAAVDSVWSELTNAETGLLNAAAFLFFMVNEVQRHSQAQHAFSVVRFDMCLEGHDGSLQPLPARAVREAARRIFNQMRPLALVGHYSGSDYAFLLPYASRAEAADFINSLVLSLTSAPLLPGDIENVSYFFGIASMPEDCTHPGVLLAAAQQALYASKGQNRPIVTFAET